MPLDHLLHVHVQLFVVDERLLELSLGSRELSRLAQHLVVQLVYLQRKLVILLEQLCYLVLVLLLLLRALLVNPVHVHARRVLLFHAHVVVVRVVATV